MTIFLGNDQPEPEENQDEAWLFQPEIILRHPEGSPVFDRRPVLESDGLDREREALEMIYRRRVEFSVGHSVSVHAEPWRRMLSAVEVRTSVLPQYEVAVTETPGLEPEDRPAMRRMIQDGYLDMQKLAQMENRELVAALSILTDDYEEWIGELRPGSPQMSLDTTRPLVRRWIGAWKSWNACEKESPRSTTTPEPWRRSVSPIWRWPRSACGVSTRSNAVEAKKSNWQISTFARTAPGVRFNLHSSCFLYLRLQTPTQRSNETSRCLCRSPVVPDRWWQDGGVSRRGRFHDGYPPPSGRPGRHGR